MTLASQIGVMLKHSIGSIKANQQTNERNGWHKGSYSR
jgi:hypothetical protein